MKKNAAKREKKKRLSENLSIKVVHDLPLKWVKSTL